MSSQRRPAIVRAFAELRRRRVFGAVAAYVVLAALIIELSGAIFEALLLPDWSARLVTVLLILGLPLVAVLSWFFDISMHGLERTDRKRDAGQARADTAGLLQRSRGAPVPDAPVRRRRRVEAGSPGADPEGPDPERIRRATLGHMRHELRTPINGIIGYSEMLLEDAEDPGLVADLERIRQAGRQLLERVDALLLGTEGPAGGDGDLEAFAAKVRLDLRTPVSAVVGYAEMLEERCEESGRSELLEDLGRIVRSARRLLELSDEIVRMATRAAPEASVLGQSSSMTEQVLAKIRPAPPGGGAAEGEGRLLVVDDNETNRDLISRQLARFGYVVATAGDGEQALELMRQQEFDLVLLDVIMPVLDGVETLTRLRSEERLADTPVIMLSSLNELDSAVRCIELGATDYIAKPVQPTLLEARIAAALESRELRSREQAYRRRVEADSQLIERLLAGAFPDSALDRVRDGALDLRERYADATVVRVSYPPALRPTSDPAGLARVEAVQEAARVVEALAAQHAAEILLWRSDGVVVVFGAESHAAAGADLALGVAARLEGSSAGVHVGPLVAGVVGELRPRFEIWGEAVESAEALALEATPGTVLITPGVRSTLGEAFVTEGRGVKEIRGRGQMKVYSLLSRRDEEAPAQTV